FWTAIANGNIKSVKIHLNQIDINDQSTVFFGLTPLSIAAATGKSKMVKFLLKQGVDINSRNKDGGTALHGAVFLGRSKSVQLLLEHGIDIKAQSHNGIKASDLLSTHTDTIDIINQSFRLGLNRDEIEKGRSEVSQLLGF
ncbi:MAG: ankyrin repeat domain-containing protein, partial [Candidatus Poribacteria bacterium]|nr:ankyrin repeat domain-containing protein [Candidatus Poribacteria bacterium]